LSDRDVDGDESALAPVAAAAGANFDQSRVGLQVVSRAARRIGFTQG
jgi:hypothetical protein